MTTLHLTKSIGRSPVRSGSVLIALALTCIAVVPTPNAFGVVPPPDGGYLGANTAEGDNALLNLTSGIANTAVGFNSLAANTTGGWNVAIGSSALASNTIGSFNMAIGTDALTKSTANYNLAIGFRVGFMNTTGIHLTGVGAGALFNNTTGSFNTAIGSDALSSNTTGESNTANGEGALFRNTIGGQNTANGDAALAANTSGFQNTATGVAALAGNTTGHRNTAVGAFALGGGFFELQTGSENTAIGQSALISNETGDRNTAVGTGAPIANASGSDNVALGPFAGGAVTRAHNVICIGHPGADVSDTCFIGNIRNVTTQNADAIPVYIDSAGQLGTTSSSLRFKHNVRPMDRASESILGLKPVTFHYNGDKTTTPQFGLIAEEVAAVNPNLVIRDKKGDIYTVRYDAVNAMLLNEFLKEHRTVQKLESTVAKQEAAAAKQDATIAKQQKQIEALTAGLQKISDQLALSKPAPRTVAGNP